MNKYNKIYFSLFFIINASIILSLDQDEIENRNLELQFTPNFDAPFTQEKDDIYFTELLRNIIKLDNEIHHDPMSIMKQIMKDQPNKLLSLPEYFLHNQSRYILMNQDKSFGWNAPGAIISALWQNGVATTPNEIIITIEKSQEFPGKYKAIIKGRGLYPHGTHRVTSAQSELTNFINQGPTEISKYENLEEITSIDNIEKNKKQLKNKIPTIQGHVKCDKYLHGTDITGTIYFDGIVMAYLIQEKNGNRYKYNSVSKQSQQKISSQLIFDKLTKKELSNQKDNIDNESSDDYNIDENNTKI